MDLAVNKLFKDKLTNHFVEWYATQVFESLQEGGEGNVHETAKNFTPDLRLSVLKPIHVKWVVVSVFMDLVPLRDTFIHGRKKALTPLQKPAEQKEQAVKLEDNISCDGAAPQPVVLSEEDASSSGESTEAVAKNPGARLPTIPLSSSARRLNKIQEWFLPSNFSQSTLEGRFGSNAYVVSALEVVQTFLSRDMALPQTGQQPRPELVHGFIGAMRNGCERYESVPGLGFLSVDRALALWPGLKLGIANTGTLRFSTRST